MSKTKFDIAYNEMRVGSNSAQSILMVSAFDELR
jgi:hypothetical protein